MRKILSLALAFCLALLLSVPAFADGRGPAFSSFDVVCRKDTPYYEQNWERDGVWEKKGMIPAGTVLTVEYEYEKDGETYGYVEINSGQNYLYIRMSDVDLKDDTYLPENTQKLEKPHSVRVIAKGGVPMYAGPNKKYDKIITIPRGTKLTYTYGNDQSATYRTWAYVKYLNKSGWIYVLDDDIDNGIAVLPDEDEKAELWVLSDGVKLYDGMSFGNIEDQLDGESYTEEALQEWHTDPDRVVGTLEKGKKYTYRYSHTFEWFGTWYYVTAGLRSGWTFVSYETKVCRTAVSASKVQQGYFMSYEPLKLKLHETPDVNAPGKTVTIKRNTVLNPEYAAYCEQGILYYETIDGESGWFLNEDAWGSCAQKVTPDEMDYYATQNRSGSAVPIYADAINRNKTVGKIPAGSFFSLLYAGSYREDVDGQEYPDWVSINYIRCGNVSGWILADDLMEPDEDPNDGESDYDEAWNDDEWDDEDWDEEDWDEEDWDEENWDDEDWDEEYWDEEDWDEEEMTDAAEADVSHSGMSPMQIVLICVVGAVVLALTAVVTLLLIRRKRGAKNAPVQTTADEPPQDAPEAQPESSSDTDSEPPTDA